MPVDATGLGHDVRLGHLLPISQVGQVRYGVDAATPGCQCEGRDALRVGDEFRSHSKERVHVKPAKHGPMQRRPSRGIGHMGVGTHCEESLHGFRMTSGHGHDKRRRALGSLGIQGMFQQTNRIGMAVFGRFVDWHHPFAYMVQRNVSGLDQDAECLHSVVARGQVQDVLGTCAPQHETSYSMRVIALLDEVRECLVSVDILIVGRRHGRGPRRRRRRRRRRIGRNGTGMRGWRWRRPRLQIKLKPRFLGPFQPHKPLLHTV